MSLTQREIEDALMEAEAEFREIIREIELEFSGPPDMRGLKLLFSGMPDATKAMLQQADPEGFDKVSKLMTQS